MNTNKKPLLYLLTHQDFNKICVFYEEPSNDEVFNVIENKYKKKVIDFKRLDSENFLFIFDDNTDIELLLRNSEYVK